MRRFPAAILGSALLLSVPASAYAQAYIGDPNSLSADLAYTYAPSGKVISTSSDDGDGFLDYVPGVPEFVHIFNLVATYNLPVEGLQAEAGIPLMGLQMGDTHFIHYPTPGPYDDGNTHWTLTDFRGGLRYQVKPIEQYVGLSFNLAGSIPVTDYPTYGFLFPDHHLKALYLGTAIARTLDPIVPDLYFQFVYEYAKVEKVNDDAATESFNRDYSSFDAQLGYFLPKNFTIGAGINARKSHGGITFGDLIFQPKSVQVAHDRLLKEDFILAGGNIGYAFSDNFELGATVRFFVWGANTRNQNLFSVNADYRFF